MPKYLLQASYNADGVRGIADEGGSSRRDEVAKIFEASGGALEGFYFAFGESDVYVFGELPDNETAAAIALTVNGAGKVQVKTVVLLTPEQLDAASKVAVSYRPPGE